MVTTIPTERIPKIERHGLLFPRIGEAALRFGVSRIHLYRVLKGQIPDHHDFRRRYAAFSKGAAK